MKKNEFCVPLIEPAHRVSKITHNQKKYFQKLPQITEAQFLKCPDCAGTKGFYNGPEDAWSCAADDCLSNWLVYDSAVWDASQRIKRERENAPKN